MPPSSPTARLRAFLRQPTTVAGLATLLGTLTALLSGQIRPAQAVPLAVGALVSILLPDDSAARSDATRAARDLVALAADLEGKDAAPAPSPSSSPLPPAPQTK